MNIDVTQSGVNVRVCGTIPKGFGNVFIKVLTPEVPYILDGACSYFFGQANIQRLY